MNNIQSDNFDEKINLISSLINAEKYSLALDLLAEFYKQYNHIWGCENKKTIYCEFVLAQLNIAVGDIHKAKYYYEISIPKIISNDGFGDDFVIEAQIVYIRFLITDKDYAYAISCLEKLHMQLKICIENNVRDYLTVIDLLSSLYSVEGFHQKSVDMTCEMIAILMEEHEHRYGKILTKDNIDFSKEVIDKLISLHLDAGASFSRLEKYHDAKQYLEHGYFLSFNVYGDHDERSLKLNYNLAVNEMQGIDPKEGIRQLHFVYEDMVKYLGSDNEYTKKAYNTLKMVDEIKEN